MKIDNEAYHDMSCLGGTDLNRHPVTAVCQIIRGQWCDAEFENPLILREMHTAIMGWGTLDGPAHHVTIEGAPWYYSVPVKTIERMKKRASFCSDLWWAVPK